MRLIRLTNYLLAHRITAFLLVLCITLVPILGVFGILYAGLVTLRKGMLEGLLFTLAATLPYLASYYLTNGQIDHMTLIVWGALGVAILSNLLTWVFACMLRRAANWSNLLQIATLLGVLCVSVIHLVYPNVASWWEAQLQLYYNKIAITEKAIASVLSDTQIEAINLIKQYATGLVTAAILLNAILQLMIARFWQSTLFYPGLLRRELHAIRFQPLAGALFALGLLFAYLGNQVAIDILPILYLLFGIAGLSLIHYLFGLFAGKTRWFWLWLLYITFFIALPMSLFFISIFALGDTLLNVRHRVKKNMRY